MSFAFTPECISHARRFGIRRLSIALMLPTLAILQTGCFHFVNTRLEALPSQATSERIIRTSYPVKLHLADGNTVVFPRGARITPTHVEGEGKRSDAASINAIAVRDTSVARSEVARLLLFRGVTDDRKTLLVNLVAIAATVGPILLIPGKPSKPLFGPEWTK